MQSLPRILRIFVQQGSVRTYPKEKFRNAGRCARTCNAHAFVRDRKSFEWWWWWWWPPPRARTRFESIILDTINVYRDDNDPRV